MQHELLKLTSTTISNNVAATEVKEVKRWLGQLWWNIETT
jgi:hypothetical protein